MKSIIYYLSFCFALLIPSKLSSINAFAEVKGCVRTEFRKTTPFSQIDCRINANVEIVKSKIRNIQVTAPEKLLPLIELTERNGLLIISSGSNSFMSDSLVTIIIYVPSIDAVCLSGSGAIHSQCPVEKICLSGSGIISCEGKISQISIELSGTGEINLIGMKLDYAVIQIPGSGNVYVNVSDKLEISVPGNGTVYYKGKPLISSSFIGEGKLVAMK